MDKVSLWNMWVCFGCLGSRESDPSWEAFLAHFNRTTCFGLVGPASDQSGDRSCMMWLKERNNDRNRKNLKELNMVEFWN